MSFVKNFILINLRGHSPLYGRAATPVRGNALPMGVVTSKWLLQKRMYGEHVMGTMPSLPLKRIKVPNWGPEPKEGTIVEFFKDPGQTFGANEVIAKVRAGATAIEIRANEVGLLRERKVKVNEKLKAGQEIITYYAAPPEKLLQILDAMEEKVRDLEGKKNEEEENGFWVGLACLVIAIVIFALMSFRR